MLNHPYLKVTSIQGQPPIEPALHFLEDSLQLSLKCRDFLNAVCRHIYKQQSQMVPQTQRPSNMNNTYMGDPTTKTPPMMRTESPTMSNNMMMMQQHQQQPQMLTTKTPPMMKTESPTMSSNMMMMQQQQQPQML